ncbi:hypothetical protein [Engelhardtia mirabilis]|uniref:Uncharacterized protein n=1 Tax=Engelhardtia mirabilis TaxID=2528011 RepID=A0A518BGU1_9BACT|nr:hypothetical protein Pla133_12740 [Planctomycetes bacterium Pla133]QDV00535.1 hypothetical protein Pla86_12740 [Planctomycetes bacterium Pla86]
MSSIRRFALLFVLLGSLLPGLARAEDLGRLGIVGRTLFGPTQSGSAAVGLDIEVVWTAFVSEASSETLDLSTDVEIRVGNYSETRTVRVLANPGAGVCSEDNYGQPCGTGLVDDQTVELICLGDGVVHGQFPWITTKFPAVPTSMFEPGDQIFVTLTPAAGAEPELDTSDDFVVETTASPTFYDRSFSSVELKPVAGIPDTYDIVVEYRQAFNTSIPPLDLRTDIVMEQGGKTTVFETWCGPWLIAPSSGCGDACVEQTCAVISCGGETVAKMFCQPVENAWGQFSCACISEPIQYTIPSVQLKADDCLVLSLAAPAGAMSDPAGLDHDQWVVCSNEAQSATYGKGKAGTLGVPTLDSIAQPVPGQMVGIKMKEALPGASPILLLGFEPIELPFDDGLLLVNPVSVIFLATPVAGDGSLTLKWQMEANPDLCGVGAYYQVMFMDAGAAGPLHLAMTNGLNHVFGW